MAETKNKTGTDLDSLSGSESKNVTRRLTGADFESVVLQSERPVLVDFYADWCGPCRFLAPTIDEVASQVSQEATVGKLNIDDHPEIAQRYQIESIPTVVLFRDGKPVDRIVGIESAEHYVASLRKNTSKGHVA